MVRLSHPARGALAIATNARWDAVDAGMRKTRRMTRTVKSCGPDVALLASMHLGDVRFSQGATEVKEPFSGEITYKP